MPELTDQYYIIKEFLDNGNRYAPSTRPYLYGELPKHVRDNTNFVVPANRVNVTSEVISDGITQLTPDSDNRLKQQRLVVTEVTEEVREEVVEDTIKEKEETVEVTEEVAPKPKSTRKRN